LDFVFPTTDADNMIMLGEGMKIVSYRNFRRYPNDRQVGTATKSEEGKQRRDLLLCGVRRR
jgi:hypothetical protein